MLKTVTSSVAACMVGAIAIIKTDTNMFVKALCILLTFISTLVATYFISVAYASSCVKIVTAISFENVPFFANIVALIAISTITLVFTPILIGLSRLSTIALPCATLLVLGYQEQAYTFYNSVMSSERNHGIQAIE